MCRQQSLVGMARMFATVRNLHKKHTFRTVEACFLCIGLAIYSDDKFFYAKFCPPHPKGFKAFVFFVFCP